VDLIQAVLRLSRQPSARDMKEGTSDNSCGAHIQLCTLAECECVQLCTLDPKSECCLLFLLQPLLSAAAAAHGRAACTPAAARRHRREFEPRPCTRAAWILRGKVVSRGCIPPVRSVWRITNELYTGAGPHLQVAVNDPSVVQRGQRGEHLRPRHIVALYHRPSTSYQIHERIRHPSF
jgi:hypothetical protein